MSSPPAPIPAPAPRPLLLLAPMEGLLDATLRDALTLDGPACGLDRCVSEFIRITGTLLPPKAFLRVVPELAHGSRTPGGVPVRPQLLGSDPACLADNAARLIELGAEGVDLNFGCPAKIVNRHGGGALLLKEPERLHAIVAAVRRAVPATHPVSAKMRLGFDDDSVAEACAQALAAGGAVEIVVHARTRDQGYRPPAWWSRVAAVRAAVAVPVIANGEIWTVADALRCRAESGCEALMLGRGQVADPGLAAALRGAEDRGARWAGGGADGVSASLTRVHEADPADAAPAGDWAALAPRFVRFVQRVEAGVEARHRAGRLKQWLNLLRRHHPQAAALHAALRTETDAPVLAEAIARSCAAARSDPVAANNPATDPTTEPAPVGQLPTRHAAAA